MASWRNALLFHPSRLFRGCRSLPRTRLAYWKPRASLDRKSTRLNSSHSQISYAVFCLKKKKELQLQLIQRPCPVVDFATARWSGKDQRVHDVSDIGNMLRDRVSLLCSRPVRFVCAESV